jgi:serine/threonine-protein kinase
MPALNHCRAGVALVIGVGEYLRAERVEPLRFATHDAIALADALTDPDLCAFPHDQVILLTNNDARRDEVVQRLSRWLPERARGTELVVIYFAGHGMVQTVGRREEGFLLPYDADPEDVVTRGIAMSDLANWIDGFNTQAVVVCLDCCHAGKVLGQRDASSTLTARNMELKPAVLQGMSGKGRYLIASCDEGQKSFECAELGHGLFTYHLLRGIAGAADRDGDGRVGLAELFNYVSTAVSRDAREKFGREQKPWTSATWADETYISSPNSRTPVQGPDPIETIWRDQGVAVAVKEIERAISQADEERLRRWLGLLGRVKEPAGLPTIFRCLGHASEVVRKEARSALHSFGWETVVSAVEGLARRGDPADLAAILDGLNAFEAHSQVVGLLDRLVTLLKGELRNRAVLLLERKRLGLGLDSVAALFREIHSPYQIQRVLGQGLFTETYLACDEGTGLEVVVRVLRPEFASQPQVRVRFLDLTKESVHLVHEKLALTREARAFPDRHIYFAVRDYVPGVTLQRALEAGKRFEPLQAVRLLREVAEALTPLHRKSAYHGGIKPSNIFLGEGDRVTLGDPSLPVQGIGVALVRLAYDYRYAPPEMFLSGEVLGPRSDFYALGCVAYELLWGEPPFLSDNFNELVARHLNGSIVLPSWRVSWLGERGDAMVLKLLARSPAQRYETLAEVLETFTSLENALKRPTTGECPAPSVPSLPLLHEESLVNYQAGQSVVNFEQTAIPVFEGDVPAGAPGPATEEFGLSPEADPVGAPEPNEKGLPEVPGYEILQRLGRGGMGTVYKAQDVRLKRLVALKALPRRGEDTSEILARFEREAVAVARLDHPNIVQIYGAFEHQGAHYLVLEYVGGGDLAKLCAGATGGLPIREAVEMMLTLARAVHCAHEAGIVHRDLKPSNILLTLKGEAKIADFGLSKIQEDLRPKVHETHPGTIMGTPSYMSPEQYRGVPASPAADIYALGVIFYELLAGRRPFPGNSPWELYQLHAEEPPPPLTGVRPEIPRELEAICLRCLEKEPSRRYPTAADLAADLKRWLRGKPIAGGPAESEEGGTVGPAESEESVPAPPPPSHGTVTGPAAKEESVPARPPNIWRRLLRFFSLRKSVTSRKKGETHEG